MRIENPIETRLSCGRLYLDNGNDPFPELGEVNKASILFMGDPHFPSSEPVSKRMARLGRFPFMKNLINSGYSRSCDELVTFAEMINLINPDLVIELGDHDADLATLSDRVYTAVNVFRPAFTESRRSRMIFVPGNHDADNLPAFLNTFFNYGIQFGYQRIGSGWLLIFTDTNLLNQDQVQKLSIRYRSDGFLTPSLEIYLNHLTEECRDEFENVTASIQSNPTVMELGRLSVSELMRELFERQKTMVDQALKLASDEERKVIGVGHDMKELARLLINFQHRKPTVSVFVAGHRHIDARFPSLTGSREPVRHYVSGADPFFRRSFSFFTLSDCEYRVNRLKPNTEFREYL